MKPLLAYLFIVLSLGLTFNVNTEADDTRDFEIEGMGIGDSALDFFSKDEIKNARRATSYKNDTYTTLQFDQFKSENYDYMSVSYKSIDNTYIIVGISGGKYFKKNINDCYSIQDQIYKDFKVLFPNSKFHEISKKKLASSINGTSRQAYIKLSDGSFAGIQCYDYGKQDRSDVLRVSLYSKDYNYWLVNIAFK
jgi:hypothetical protein